MYKNTILDRPCHINVKILHSNTILGQADFGNSKQKFKKYCVPKIWSIPILYLDKPILNTNQNFLKMSLKMFFIAASY